MRSCINGRGTVTSHSPVPSGHSQQSLVRLQQPWREFTQQLQEGQVDEPQLTARRCWLLECKLDPIPEMEKEIGNGSPALAALPHTSPLHSQQGRGTVTLTCAGQPEPAGSVAGAGQREARTFGPSPGSPGRHWSPRRLGPAPAAVVSAARKEGVISPRQEKSPTPPWPSSQYLLQAEEQSMSPLQPIDLAGPIQRLLDYVPIVIVELEKASGWSSEQQPKSCCKTHTQGRWQTPPSSLLGDAPTPGSTQAQPALSQPQSS